MAGFCEAGIGSIFLFYLYMQDSLKALLLGRKMSYLLLLAVQSQESAFFTLFPRSVTPTHSTVLWSTPDRQTDILPPSLYLPTAGEQNLHKGYSRHRDESRGTVELDNTQWG